MKIKLKKHFYTAIIPIILLTGLGTHIVAIILYALTHPKELDNLDASTIFNTKIYDYILSDPNGQPLLLGTMILLFILSTYLVRQSIFQKTYRDDSDFGVHGSARFEDPKRLMDGRVLSNKASYSNIPFIGYKKALDMEEGIILGKVGKKVLVIPDKTEISNKNVLVVGPSGSGKGQTNVIPNLVNIKNQSIINIDVKGENWHLTHQIKVDQGFKVGRLDFVDFKGWGFNPMAFVQNDEDAEKLANITAKNAVADGKEDFFQERARTLLKNMIVYTKTNFSQEDANFDSLLTVYDKYIANEQVFNEWINTQDQEDIGVQGLKSFFASLTGKTRSSVTSSFDSIISVYRLSKVREMTKKSDFEFEDFVNDKYALYIKIAVPSNPYKSLTSAFFTQMIDAFFTIARKSPISALPTPVNLLLDEFANIGKIEAYANTLSLCRGYLIYITTIIQDLSQLEKVYGKEDFKNIIANHDTKLILRVSEKETAKYFSEYFGETTVTYDEVTGTGNRAESKPHTVKKPLVTVNDLMTMDKDEAYVQFTGFNVCKIEKAWQFVIFGDMVTKRRKYNYDKFRKRLLNVNENPLYREEIEHKEMESFTDMFNKKNDVVEERHKENEQQLKAQEYQEEIRKPLSIEEIDKIDQEEQQKYVEHVQAKIKTRLSIIEGIEKFVQSNEQIENKEVVLNQLRENAEALTNGESSKIKSLNLIKDRNMKNIARLEAKRIETNFDAENDENDNLLLDIEDELETQKTMVHMLESDEHLVSDIINEYQKEKMDNQVIDQDVDEFSIEKMVENHLSNPNNDTSYNSGQFDDESDEEDSETDNPDEENKDDKVAVGNSISEDKEDPFKDFGI
ncbi:VirD4-like conjugal transfer protein, CD1115 family [Bacillus paralicheniformis]|uniref:VirD4-like conjugal transfer protein, CD1115 family n=1 Tax=Bacillus paralicheniformis TaxID=1648923 RepID=UPI001FD6604D|nr:type IV secretory system conjugative DNA transfer family protein [Bacillus paralicheniformis]MCJ8223705.1 type IV secretory system conjugative DNA transfer family protein [Bacillus paralicheniformis]